MTRHSKILTMIAIPFATAFLSADTVKYSYDDAGRLAAVDYGNGKTITYVYDNAGNLLNRTTTAAASSSASKRAATASGAERGKPRVSPRDRKHALSESKR
jgi:YD repeat-containing protein